MMTMIGNWQFESQSLVNANFIRTERFAGSRSHMATEPSVRLRPKLSINEQGRPAIEAPVGAGFTGASSTLPRIRLCGTYQFSLDVREGDLAPI
jgi:hypothetical protein